MANEAHKELWIQHRNAQDKYTYFLLAVAASAIAFTVQKTTHATLQWDLLLLAAAVALWGASFYFGCRNLNFVLAGLTANYEYILLTVGRHYNQPPNAELTKAAREGVESAMKANADRANFYATMQFGFLIAGAAAFLIWHVVDIVIRSFSTPTPPA